MSSKRADRDHLIENQVPVHKSKPKIHQHDLRREKKDGTREKPSRPSVIINPATIDPRVDPKRSSVAALPAAPPPTPVRTLVIASANGVTVSRPALQTHAADKRTGRYLALGVTLIMLFITLYHTFLRQVPMLAGLVPPAIIMVLYLLWIVYFAKKRKRQVEIELT